MSPRVIEPTRDELDVRRAKLLSRLKMTRDELAMRAEAGALTSEEFWLYEDLLAIEYLTGDDADR